MNSFAQSPSFTVANPHALSTILEASETKSIIASRDIFDISGTKLWRRDQPVSHALQRKLLDRQLRHPLESCLYAEDGVTVRSLVDAVEALVARDAPITALLRPHAAKLVEAAAHIPLHPVAQLLLTAGQASRPDSFDHAVQAMALNGALVIAHGGNTRDLRAAMLCGLLHDLGEMYIDPNFGEADTDRSLDFQSFQHLVVHPHVGRLLIEQLTDYPRDVARAVGEHHERLDGSGYPLCLQRDDVSPQGALLAVTECALGMLRGDRTPLARASVALRVVPGEFDLGWVSLFSYAVRSEPALQAQHGVDELKERLHQLENAMQLAQFTVATLMSSAETPELKQALELAQYLLTRLCTGWNASGLWSADVIHPHDAAEVEFIEDELLFRLRAVQRATQLRAGQLVGADAERLQQLCVALNSARS